MLTREAWNALLKMLEEPPPRVVFVFATTEPQKIAQAAAPVLSRLQRFDLKRIGPSDIRDRLRDGAGAGRRAGGRRRAGHDRARGGWRPCAMRSALTDQVLALGDVTTVTADRVRDALGLVPEDDGLAMIELVADRRAATCFRPSRGWPTPVSTSRRFSAGFADLLRVATGLILRRRRRT